MKISIYSTQILDTPPKGYGGLENIAYLEAKYLSEQGHTVYLFATEDSYEPPTGHLFSVGKAGMNPIDAWRAYWNDERSRKALMESDIVHDHSWGYYPYSVADKLKNICHTHHGPDPGFSQPPSISHPNLIAVGFNQAKRFQEQTGLQWRTVHNGIDISKYPFHKEKEDYLLWISRVYAFKGTHRFINICNKMKMKGYVVGGSFGDVADYVQMIKDKCDKSEYVDFIGEVPFERKVELYQKAKAVVLPTIDKLPLKKGGFASFIEPFGLIIPEANATGTPVIVTPSGGWKETLIHGLNGFHANSDEEFEFYIKRVLDGEIKEEDCRWIAEQFDYKKMGERYLQLFKEIEGGGW